MIKIKSIVDDFRYLQNDLPTTFYDLTSYIKSLSVAKDCINEIPLSVDLQGLKSFDFLISRLNPLTFHGIIIIHDHGLYTQFDNFRLFNR